MWQGYVYVNDVRYSNIFTFAVGIFFVNTTQVKSYILRNQNVAFSYIFKQKDALHIILLTWRACL